MSKARTVGGHRRCERITRLFEWAHSPPREERWTRHQENDAQPQIDGADGVVAHKPGLKNAFRNILCARPPRLRGLRWLRDFFIDRAATPPHEEGNAPTRTCRTAASEGQRYQSFCYTQLGFGFRLNLQF